MSISRRLTAIERAYELARSGKVRNMIEIEEQLRAENYENVSGALYGLSIRNHLRKLCTEARARAEP